MVMRVSAVSLLALSLLERVSSLQIPLQDAVPSIATRGRKLHGRFLQVTGTT